ncbi:eukaryotic integral membrane protein-domain-containing protein [Scenedesmus sp. NREL 46B-D3]|nr:eukaryotic integral membrane protein-domain-containing protein [Scenedesmus sp. NREL 46B-D3]
MMHDGPRFTRLSKVLAVVLLGLFLVTFFAPTSKEYLTLIPGRTLPCVWNLITGGLVCTNIVEVLLMMVSLLLLARVIEPVYGSTEFLKLILVVDFATSTATFCIAYIIFLSAPDERKGRTLYSEFSGFHGILAALLVAVKQIMPDQEVILAGFLRLKAVHFPSVYVLTSTLVIAALQSWHCLAFLYLGTYFAWLYLRFFQHQPETSIMGDPSEDFRFSSFFPAALAGPIDAVAGVMGKVFRLQHNAHAEAKALLPTAAAGALLGSNAVDANRRRERGAKALEEDLK